MSQVTKMIALCRNANELIRQNELDSAANVAREILQLIATPEYPEYFRRSGRGLFCAYSILGVSAISNGDISTATEMLELAGKSPLSAARRTFGPNMILPKLLLEAGQIEPVLRFLYDCRYTWDLGLIEIENWSSQIDAGKEPDFGANLDYGL